MLVNKDVKLRFGKYFADVLMIFLQLCKHRALIEPLLKCVDNQSSPEYIRFHNVIKDGFIRSFDDAEMAMVFAEIETLIKNPTNDEKLRDEG